LEPLLHLGQVAHRLARAVAVHLLRCALELLHLRHQLGGHRLSKERLRLAELAGERAVERARRLELLLELLRRLTKLLHAIGHRALLLREPTRLLGVLVAHSLLRLLLRFTSPLRRALRTLRAPSVARLRARRFVRALRERLLRGRRGARFPGRRVAELTRAGA